MSSLREQAELDLELTLEESQDFGFPISITDPTGPTTANITGQSGDIHFLIDPETGQGISGRFSHMTVRISTLVDNGITNLPVKGWTVIFNDINGNVHNWIVEEARPDRTLGIVTCLLGVLESGS